MVEGGVDIIELGAPFSDPLAEGPTIQKSSQIALEQGITLKDCLDCARRARGQFPGTSIVLMGYYNPVLSYGLERFARDAGESGVDGLIVVDLPLEEAGPLRTALRAQGIDLIFLLAPTSTTERIRGSGSDGFGVCVLRECDRGHGGEARPSIRPFGVPGQGKDGDGPSANSRVRYIEEGARGHGIRDGGRCRSRQRPDKLNRAVGARDAGGEGEGVRARASGLRRGCSVGAGTFCGAEE